MIPGDAELRSTVQDLGEAVEEVADTLEAVGADLQELESRVLGEGVDPMEPHFSLRDRVQFLERGLRRIRRYLEELEYPESGDSKLLRKLWERVASLEEDRKKRVERIGQLGRDGHNLRDDLFRLERRVRNLETGGTS